MCGLMRAWRWLFGEAPREPVGMTEADELIAAGQRALAAVRDAGSIVERLAASGRLPSGLVPDLAGDLAALHRTIGRTFTNICEQLGQHLAGEEQPGD
jgi:hypothetical protein